MLKILLKNRILAIADKFSGQSKSKQAASAGMFAGEILLGLLLLAGMAFGVSALFGNFCAALAQNRLTWAFYGAAGGLAFIVGLMLTLFYAQGAVFEAKDNELLLSMPIPPSAILASRVGSVYFLNLMCSFVLLVSAGYTVAVKGVGITVLSVIMLILCALLLALLSTTMTCLLGWVVSVITRRTRKKVLVQFLLSLIAMAAVYIVTSGMNKQMIQSISESAGNIAEAIRATMYPLYALGMAVAECDWLQLLIFAACCIVPFALIYLVMSKSFIRIVTARSGAKKQKYEATALKGSSVTWSMAKKDMTRFFNSPSYMLNGGTGLLYSLGLSVISLFTGNKLINGLLEQASKTDNSAPVIAIIVAFELSFFAAMTSISGPSISVESKNLWILKSMPVRAKEILTGKALSHIVIAFPVSLICSLLNLVCMPMPDFTGLLLMFIMPLAAHAFTALFGVISNIYFGKLDYPSIAKAAKSAGGALIPMLVMLVVLLGPLALYFIALQETMTFQACGIAVTALLFVLDAALYFFLGSAAAQKRWDRLGNK